MAGLEPWGTIGLLASVHTTELEVRMYECFQGVSMNNLGPCTLTAVLFGGHSQPHEQKDCSNGCCSVESGPKNNQSVVDIRKKMNDDCKVLGKVLRKHCLVTSTGKPEGIRRYLVAHASAFNLLATSACVCSDACGQTMLGTSCSWQNG